ncbi:hypothetical protein FOL47_006844 [Perkinsus chesapeaki]|uniref:Uncharacterized protein n=1 Tax=Perkinsus chesapeaki TaxID=330153 RepID=A0A7J6LP69_PERCH|nr:hypothetical protein FOL47_006844 [Perkinsus chesapeaki]
MAPASRRQALFKRAGMAVVGARQLAKARAGPDYTPGEERSQEVFQSDGLFLGKMFPNCSPAEIGRLNSVCEADHIVVHRGSKDGLAWMVHFIVTGSCSLLLPSIESAPPQQAFDLPLSVATSGALLDPYPIAELAAGEPFGVEDYVLSPPTNRRQFAAVYTVTVTSHECRLLSVPILSLEPNLSRKVIERLKPIYRARELTRTKHLPQVLPKSRHHFLMASRRHLRKSANSSPDSETTDEQRDMQEKAARFVREVRAEALTDFQRFSVPIRLSRHFGQSPESADLRHGILLQSDPLPVFRLWKHACCPYSHSLFVREWLR